MAAPDDGHPDNSANQLPTSAMVIAVSPCSINFIQSQFWPEEELSATLLLLGLLEELGRLELEEIVIDELDGFEELEDIVIVAELDGLLLDDICQDEELTPPSLLLEINVDEQEESSCWRLDELSSLLSELGSLSSELKSNTYELLEGSRSLLDNSGSTGPLPPPLLPQPDTPAAIAEPTPKTFTLIGMRFSNLSIIFIVMMNI